jgi:hypothetical protein
MALSVMIKETWYKADEDGFPLLADIQVGLGQWPLWVESRNSN